MSIKIAIISDTHSYHNKIVVPDADVLIHAGDITWRGELDIMQSFSAWLEALPHKHKVIVFGNHEVGFQHGPKRERAIRLIKDAGAHYLEDNGVEIEGLYFHGSAASPFFHNWEYNYRRGPEIAAIWSKIPDRTNVLITHSPPYGILDRVVRPPWGFENAGCEELMKRINQLPNLKLSCFGHLHFDGGKTEVVNGITYVNAACCDEQYNPSRPPIVVEI